MTSVLSVCTDSKQAVYGVLQYI